MQLNQSGRIFWFSMIRLKVQYWKEILCLIVIMNSWLEWTICFKMNLDFILSCLSLEGGSFIKFFKARRDLKKKSLNSIVLSLLLLLDFYIIKVLFTEIWSLKTFFSIKMVISKLLTMDLQKCWRKDKKPQVFAAPQNT